MDHTLKTISIGTIGGDLNFEDLRGRSFQASYKFTLSPLNTRSSTSICIELVIEFIRELDINVKILDYKDG